jgi:hypothetical protein
MVHKKQAMTTATVHADTAIAEIVKKQKAFFRTGKTKDLNFRIEQIKKTEQAGSAA